MFSVVLFALLEGGKNARIHMLYTPNVKVEVKKKKNVQEHPLTGEGKKNKDYIEKILTKTGTVQGKEMRFRTWKQRTPKESTAF